MTQKILNIGGIFGDYRVVKLLGASGNVDVYLMRSVTTGNFFAMKLLMPADGITAATRQRFIEAVEEARRLEGDNLVGIHECGEDAETGLYYLIMDYVDGGTLAEYMAANGPLDVAEALKTAIVAAGTLDAIHSAGMVHGGIKSTNVMFMQDGTLKIADLGISKASPTSLENGGSAASISPYCAPEKVMRGQKEDGRSDIFSLGVVLFEMLTGSLPAMPSTALELIVKVTNNEQLIPDIRTLRADVPAVVAEAVAKMCATKAEDRPQTAAAAVELLMDALRKTGGLDDDATTAKDIARKPTRIKGRRVKIKVPTNVSSIASVAYEKGEEESGGGVGKILLILILLAAAVAGAYFALRKDSKLDDAAAQAQAVDNDVNDATVRSAQVGDATWFYTVEHSKAVLWRGSDGIHGAPCVEPVPSGRVVVPEEIGGFKVGALGSLAFFDCSGMTEIVLPSTLERIGNRAFLRCSSLEVIVLPAGVKSIGKWAFNSCGALKVADLANCTEITDDGGNFAFCPSLEEYDVSPENKAFKVVGGVLYSADGKRLVAYPAALGAVEVPDGVEEIGQYAFCDSSAKRISLPSSIARIGQGAFENCRALTELKFAGAAPEIIAGVDSIFKGANRKTAVFVEASAGGWPSRDGSRWPEKDGRTVKRSFAEFAREWCDAKGRRRESTLVGIAENGAVAIMRNPGEDRVRSLTVAKLSKDDQVFISSVAARLRHYAKRNDKYEPVE